MKIINIKYLQDHPNEIFVFGDNTKRRGKKGAAMLRDESNSYGFITKKYPSYSNDAFYKLTEYREVYKKEIKRLINNITKNPDKVYLISKIGAGLANRYKIFEKIIDVNIKKDLEKFKNVEFLW